MNTISVSEIQQDFPGCLRRVQAGEVLVITEHDQPIAEIKPASSGSSGQRPADLRSNGLPTSDTVVEFLKGRVQDARVPLRWRQEGVNEPTDDCRQLCLRLAEKLFLDYGLLPSKVVASRQEGLYLDYKSLHSGRSLGIEADNELDVVAVVSDANGILASAAFEGDEVQHLLRVFFNGLATKAGDPRATDA